MDQALMARCEVVPDTGCWLWRGAHTRDGYGTVSWRGKTRLVHRVAYEQDRGPIPERFVLDHQCHRRACCNPAHLEAVPVDVNAPTLIPWNSTKTHCPRGHAYLIHGVVYRGRDGYERRYCRACKRGGLR